MDFGSVFGGIAGDIVSSGFSAYEQNRQQQFQGYMSDTAYQRRAADLRAAGLNPILAATQGPAGVPGGSMASGGIDVPGAINSGLAAERQNKLLEEQYRQQKFTSDKAYFDQLTAGYDQETARARAMAASKQQQADDDTNLYSTRAAANKSDEMLRGQDATFWLGNPKLRNMYLNMSGSSGLTAAAKAAAAAAADLDQGEKPSWDPTKPGSTNPGGGSSAESIRRRFGNIDPSTGEIKDYRPQSSGELRRHFDAWRNKR